MTTSKDTVSVVYVVGSGRSGTTLLDGILSNHPRIHGAGELALLAAEDYFNQFYCPCQQPINKCKFWTSVVDLWFQRTGLQGLEQHALARKKFEGARLIGLRRLMLEKVRSSAEFAEYARQTVELYRAISEVSGCEITVDSSAIPMRALALSLMPGIDLKLIHIVRDCRGVAWSLKKGLQSDNKSGVGSTEIPRAVWRSSLTWLAYNLVSSWVCRQVPKGKAHFVRYEDLSANGPAVMQGIADFLQCDFSDIIRVISTDQPLKVGCTFGGNRLRMKGEIRLRLDTDWTQKLSPDEQRTLTRMCGWLMRQYQYDLKAPLKKAA